MSTLDTLKIKTNVQSVFVFMLEQMKEQLDALEETKTKKSFVIHRRICEELFSVVFMAYGKIECDMVSGFSETFDELQDRFDEISDKKTEEFKEVEA